MDGLRRVGDTLLDAGQDVVLRRASGEPDTGQVDDGGDGSWRGDAQPSRFGALPGEGQGAVGVEGFDVGDRLEVGIDDRARVNIIFN